MQPGPNNGPPADLKDWQKETWYGGTPFNANPFDEPEDAPELREERSDNLYNHEGEFWQGRQPTEGYQFSPDGRPRAPEVKEKPPRKKRSLWVYAAIGAAVAAAVYFIVFYAVLSVRNIRVEGNRAFSAEQVIELSGIRKGTPLLQVDADRAARGIESNVYLRFRYLEKEMPDTVVIGVREREACCWMTWCGIFYTMDKERMVLFETEEENVQPSNLVRVDGLRIRSGCMVGQTLMLESEKQQEVFTNLFLEMKVLGCTEDILEADLSNLDSILLSTRDGFTVRMGDSLNIHAKLRSMLLTREELLRRGYSGGIINVINLENPIYSPE